MRRRDREVTDSNEIIHILDTGKVLHLGLVDQGKPYIVPMNYGYILEGNKLVFYLHGALEGRKLDIIRIIYDYVKHTPQQRPKQIK